MGLSAWVWPIGTSVLVLESFRLLVFLRNPLEVIDVVRVNWMCAIWIGSSGRARWAPIYAARAV
jgi:hypothetical protein